ncbi:DUF1295 domain-containing protein [Phenylobacterium sp.]|uniref:DUF1295 domain-containing protein n=1 Tax=Phenylobacterium sp. TaxID=1871053 RepID=UPI002FD885A0
MSIWLLLALNALVLILAFGLLWAVSLRLRDVSFIDAWWPTGMALLAWTSLAAHSASGGAVGPHGWILALAATAWAARLGGHLFARWRRHGRERRYEEMLADAQDRRGWSFPLSALVIIFAPQAPLQLIVALPVQLGQLGEPQPLGLIGVLGAALALFGLVFEAIADRQLARFKADPANKGQVMDKGLWRYSRHPNYFGDACLWWGLYLVAVETPLGAWSILGPVLITLLLTKGSGAPTVEKGMENRRPAYADYIRRTSAFIPWPPRKL